jgi:hypothetical protein
MEPRQGLVGAWTGDGVAAKGRRAPLRVDQRQPAQAGMPGAFRGHLGDEHEPAVGELDGTVRAIRLDHELAREIAVDVGGPQLASRAIPAGVDLAAADELPALDVEDVGEVGFDRDLDRQPHDAPGVVDDVVVLVDATRDRPVDPDPEAVTGDDPVPVEQLGVREFEAGRIELDRRRVEEQRPLAVEGQLIARHEARVAGEEAFLRLALDAAVRLAHDEPVVAVHGDRRWADLDREGHECCRARAPSTRSATG